MYIANRCPLCDEKMTKHGKEYFCLNDLCLLYDYADKLIKEWEGIKLHVKKQIKDKLYNVEYKDKENQWKERINKC